MLCALTVRQLKPDCFEQFADAFRPDDSMVGHEGWVRFDMLRDRTDPNRVVTFGFFDGTFDELEANQREHGYDERRAKAHEYVDKVEVNGVFEIVHEMA